MHTPIVPAPDVVLPQHGDACQRTADAGAGRARAIEVGAREGSPLKPHHSTAPQRAGEGGASPTLRRQLSGIGEVAEVAEFHFWSVPCVSWRRAEIQ